MNAQSNDEYGVYLAEGGGLDVVSEDKSQVPQQVGGKWWHGRLTLSTILALLLSTYFVVVGTTAESGTSTKGVVETEAEVNVIFPRAPLMAVALCWLADVMIWVLQTESFDRKNPVASVLSATLVRTMVILGALAFSSATKWPAHNLFSAYLVGCYFSFLALESWLAIRRSATRNYSPKPL